jgi:DNA-binding transcriptional ArsR family regulator
VSSYQALHDRTYKGIERLGDTGVFDGNQAARTVLVHFAMNLSSVNDIEQGLAEGYVMEGCIPVAQIMRKTRLSKPTVQRAVKWLRQQGYIEVQYLHEGGRQYFGSIKVTLPEQASRGGLSLVRNVS